MSESGERAGAARPWRLRSDLERRASMNVAITRAKELLVVIGNAELLKRDPYWKGLLQFALRHEL
jgi:hypothetical protein